MVRALSNVLRMLGSVLFHRGLGALASYIEGVQFGA